MSENKISNLISSRNHVEIKSNSNPSIVFRTVGSDYLVVTQNNQSICIYRNQMTDLKEALEQIELMFQEEESTIKNVKIAQSPFEPNRLDLLVAGKLEEYDSNPNLEFEPKTLTEEDIVDSVKSESEPPLISVTEDTKIISDVDPITITEVGTITSIEEKIETIIVSDTVEKEIESTKPSKKSKSTKSPKKRK